MPSKNPHRQSARTSFYSQTRKGPTFSGPTITVRRSLRLPPYLTSFTSHRNPKEASLAVTCHEVLLRTREAWLLRRQAIWGNAAGWKRVHATSSECGSCPAPLPIRVPLPREPYVLIYTAGKEVSSRAPSVEVEKLPGATHRPPRLCSAVSAPLLSKHVHYEQHSAVGMGGHPDKTVGFRTSKAVVSLCPPFLSCEPTTRIWTCVGCT